MREHPLHFRALTTLGFLGFLVAVAAAGCGGGGSTVASIPSGATAAPGSSCAPTTGGVAYLSDGGAGTAGLTLVPFESTAGALATTCATRHLTASASLSDFAVSAAGDALALQTSGSTVSVVGIGGLSNGSSPYLTGFSQDLSHAFGGSHPPTSVALHPLGTFGFAVGYDTTSTAGFLGINNILNQAPTPAPSPTATPTARPGATPTAVVTPIPNASAVPYTSIGASTPGTSTALAVTPSSPIGRTTVALAPDGSTILVRGYDLIAFEVQATTAGFFFSYPQAGTTSPITMLGAGENPALGYPSGIGAGALGHGLVAFYPQATSQALIGGTTTNPGTITLVTGLPVSITSAASLTMPATVTSVAVSANDTYGVVGTQSGLYVVRLVGTLSQVTPTASARPTYTKASGGTATLTNVISVGFSPDAKYVVALADDGGGTASLLVFPIDGNGNLSAPVTVGPSFPTPHGDYLIVR